MTQALKMLRPILKEVAELVFPKAAYERRFRIWLETEPELRLLPAICRSDAIAVDIGANEGFFAYHLLPLAKEVVAFEPLPEMLRRLRARYEDQMRIVGVVLSDHAGEGRMRYPAGGYMTATIAATNHAAQKSGRTIHTVTVPMNTLDSFELRNVGFVKIDVEGHEESVLNGGLRTLQREMPNLMIEIEERHAPGCLSRVSTMLNRVGFSGYYLQGKELLPLAMFDLEFNRSNESISRSRYVNNFLFFPNDQLDHVLERVQPYL